MIYTATLETAEGIVRAVWNGGTSVQLFAGDDDTARDSLDVWNYETNEPSIPKNAEALARHVRSWFWETERGIEIERITCSTILELDPAE